MKGNYQHNKFSHTRLGTSTPAFQAKGVIAEIRRKMKIYITSIVLTLVCSSAAFWAGSQHGQRQNWLLYSGLDAVSMHSKLTLKPFDESETLSKRERNKLESELDELIKRYGGYVSNGHSFYHGNLNKSKAIHSFFESPIKYRLENPRMKYSLEAKKLYLAHYNSEYEKSIASGEPGNHEETRDWFLNEINYMYSALDKHAN